MTCPAAEVILHKTAKWPSAANAKKRNPITFSPVYNKNCINSGRCSEKHLPVKHPCYAFLIGSVSYMGRYYRQGTVLTFKIPRFS